MRRFLVMFLTILAVVFLFSVQLYVVYPETISHSRTALIVGWYWIRSPGAWFEWKFSPVSQVPSIIFINVKALVTNGTNGGSGYSETVHWKILDPTNNIPMMEGKLYLHNPFLPRVSYYTKGLGYAAYGSVGIKLPVNVREIIRNRGFKFRVTWPGEHRYHVAFNKDPKYLFLVYEK